MNGRLTLHERLSSPVEVADARFAPAGIEMTDNIRRPGACRSLDVKPSWSLSILEFWSAAYRATPAM